VNVYVFLVESENGNDKGDTCAVVVKIVMGIQGISTFSFKFNASSLCYNWILILIFLHYFPF